MAYCEIDGCTRKHFGRGLCSMHYWRVRRHGEAGEATPQTRTPRGDGPPEECSMDGCTGRRYARGFCLTHYERDLRNGDPNVVRRIYRLN